MEGDKGQTKEKGINHSGKEKILFKKLFVQLLAGWLICFTNILLSYRSCMRDKNVYKKWSLFLNNS